MSVPCNQTTATGPCQRRVAKPGADCGVTHTGAAGVSTLNAAAAPNAGPAPAPAGLAWPEATREPSPKILELRRLAELHGEAPAEADGDFDRKNRYQHNPLGDGRDIWTTRNGIMLKVQRAATASEADNAALRNRFVAERPVTDTFRPGADTTDTDLEAAMKTLDRNDAASDARYARLNLQGLRNTLANHHLDDDYLRIAETDQDAHGTLVIDDARYTWDGEHEVVGDRIGAFLMGLDRHNRDSWDRYVERDDRGDPVRLRARFLAEQTTVLHDGDL